MKIREIDQIKAEISINNFVTTFDYLNENNIKVFGPNKIASQLEGSKTFTKELCKKYNINVIGCPIIRDVNNVALSSRNFLLKVN